MREKFKVNRNSPEVIAAVNELLDTIANSLNSYIEDFEVDNAEEASKLTTTELVELVLPQVSDEITDAGKYFDDVEKKVFELVEEALGNVIPDTTV